MILAVGTFDISILRLKQGVVEVLATGGESALGGDDFDHAIAEWVLEQADYKKTATASLVRLLMSEARSAKKKITSDR